MPGSPGDPVHLDPFTDIVEVHWQTNVLAIKFDMRLASKGVTFGGTCDPVTSSLNVPRSSDSEKGTEFGYGPSPASNTLTILSAWTAKTRGADTDWNVKAIELVTVNNSPSPLESTTYGQWEVSGGSLGRC